jgi:hypothetical protein
MKSRIIVVYGTLWLVCWLGFATLWHWQMAGDYFVCRHHGLILDFIPPFVHEGTGDFYLKPPRSLFGLWAVFLTGVFILPALGTWAFMRLYDRDLKRAWR